MPLTLTNMTVSLTPVYSTTYAASVKSTSIYLFQVPSSINNAVTNWLFYFMIMDLSSMTIQFGIALPDLTQFTYDSQQISTTYFTSIGSTMSFVFSSGIIFNTGAPTPQTLTMIDTKIWLNLDFSVLTYRNLMDHPVTAWYRIPFTLIFPTILPVLGSLPSEPTLNSISSKFLGLVNF